MNSTAIMMAATKGRLRLARFLILVGFVWPFINANYFFRDAEFEVNFLPALLAVLIAPEILASDGIARR